MTLLRSQCTPKISADLSVTASDKGGSGYGAWVRDANPMPTDIACLICWPASVRASGFGNYFRRRASGVSTTVYSTELGGERWLLAHGRLWSCLSDE